MIRKVSLIFLLVCFLSTAVSFAADITIYEATILRVVDGDTIQVNLGTKKERVRLIGVDTPETKHPKKGVQYFGAEAFEFTKKNLPEGKKIFLEFDVGQRDRYGRLLAYVWLQKPAARSVDEIRNKMFNAHLLVNGYAQIMTIQPNIKYVDHFRKFQTEARENNQGLWK